MALLVDALRFVNLFAAAIAVGGWLLVLLAVVPARARLAGGAEITFHNASTERIDRYLPPSVAVSIVAAVGVAVLDRALTPPVLALLVGGALAMAVAAAIALGINMPMNRRIAQWSSDEPPGDAADIWRRWDRFHTLRTLAGVAALACFVGVAVFR